MSRILTPRIGARVAATLAGLLLASPLLAVTPASAAVAPPIDRSFAAPTPNLEADPFYTPPATIPTGNPGDIIRARVSNAGPPKARALANAWQVMYLSTDALGNPNVVTGTILVPKDADPKTVPVAAVAPGTTGPAFRCTVSRYINSGAFYEQPSVNQMLEAGYAVAVTDYEGYRQNPQTSYIIGKPMGAAVLNAVRAATRLPEADLSPTPKVVVRGYSQGGGATMWAGQMASTYAPELNIVGIAGGGVPANISLVAIALQKAPAFGFLLNALIGLDNAYPDLLLDNYLTPTGKTTVQQMENDDCTVELLLNYAGKQISDYTTTSPLSTTLWRSKVLPNTLGSEKINVPVYQYQGTVDEIIPYGQATVLRDQYCALGVDLQWAEMPVGHITGVARGNEGAFQFLQDRVAGRPTTPNCPAAG